MSSKNNSSHSSASTDRSNTHLYITLLLKRAVVQAVQCSKMYITCVLTLSTTNNNSVTLKVHVQLFQWKNAMVGKADETAVEVGGGEYTHMHAQGEREKSIFVWLCAPFYALCMQYNNIRCGAKYIYQQKLNSHHHFIPSVCRSYHAEAEGGKKNTFFCLVIHVLSSSLLSSKPSSSTTTLK